MERGEQLSAREVEAMAAQHGTGKGWSDADRGWSSGAGVRNRFPLLTGMATTLRFIGWLAVAGGVLLAFLQVIPWLTCILDRSKVGGAASCGAAVLILAPVVGSFVIGFGLIAFGEMIGVFRAIEGNTYQLLSSVEQVGYRNKLTGEGA